MLCAKRFPSSPSACCYYVGTVARSVTFRSAISASPLWVSLQTQIPFKNIITKKKKQIMLQYLSICPQTQIFSYSSFKKRKEGCSEFPLLKYLCLVWKSEGHIFSKQGLYKINMKLQHSWCLTVEVFVSWNFLLGRSFISKRTFLVFTLRLLLLRYINMLS